MTNLSVPSVIFADASWYGSLRGGVTFGSGNTDFYDGGSRWGIKGSSEVSEGLTAVYQFETGIDSGANQAGRLNYVGLSGGFGNLTLGRVWSASYNHAGVIRDFPNWHTASDTSGRVGSAVSYALSTDQFSMQIDAVMDSEVDTGSAVDQLEFGMTVGLGDLGKIAFGYTKKEDVNTTRMVTDPAVEATAGTPMMPTEYEIEIGDDDDAKMVKVDRVAVVVTIPADADAVAAHDYLDKDGMLKEGDDAETAFKNAIKKNGDSYHTDDTACMADEDAGTECNTITVYVQTTTTEASAGPGAGDVTPASDDIAYHLVDEADVTVTPHPAVDPTPYVPAMKREVDDIKPGSKASHVSAEFGLGAVTAALGYSEMETEGMSAKAKTTFIGVSGSLGDSGLNWGAWTRKKESATGAESSPWTVGLSKSLGGGASAYIDHHNDGSDSTTSMALRVDF